ncbi:uncharacterized protein TNCV_2154361 [Trichonephila clavipes]|nr:uncharacterized protein TNCV_2154361 [Trichonephila clavipes]
MDEILTTARDLELEVNEDDIEELIMGHEDELTTEELREILNEEHQETQVNVSLSEQAPYPANEADYQLLRSYGNSNNPFLVPLNK